MARAEGDSCPARRHLGRGPALSSGILQAALCHVGLVRALLEPALGRFTPLLVPLNYAPGL